MFQLSQNQKDRETGPGLQPMSQRHRLDIYKTRIAAAALPFLAVVLAACQMVFSRSEIDRGTDALKNSYLIRRPTEARISRFAYAPLGLERGDDQEPADHTTRDRAERILQDAFAERPGPESRHALGRFYLAKREFDQAISLFEAALKDDPSNAELLSDIGAALLEKGRIARLGEEPGKSVEEWAKSLEYLNRAVELNRKVEEALFNRALLYEELMLPAQAEEDWQRYLEKDSRHGWADEGRRKLGWLEEQRSRAAESQEQLYKDFLVAHEARDDEKAWQVLKQSRGVISSILIDRLIDDFLELSEKGRRDDARKSLEMILYAGSVEEQKAGDRFTSKLAAYYRATTLNQQKNIMQARSLLKSGYESFGQAGTQESIDLYSRAKQEFDKAGDTFESMFADYWLVHCYLRSHQEDQSLAILNRLTRTCEDESYKSLLVRCLYALSGIQFNFNEHSKAIEYSNQSLKLAEQVGDTNGILKALTPIIDYYRYLGNYQQCMNYIQRSLPLMSSGSLEPIQVWRHCGVVAWAFCAFGFQDAAVDYQKQALRLAKESGRSSMVSVSFAHLGIIHGKRQNNDEALENIKLALDMAKGSSEVDADTNLMAYSYLQMGHIQRQAQDYNSAIASYDQSIDHYNRLAFSTHLYQAHKGRLLCYLAQKNDSMSREEIQTTLGLLEKYRSRILEGDNRNSFFDLEQNVYDLAMDFEYARMGDPQRAFEYSEESRARSLLDLMNQNARLFASGDDPDAAFQLVSRPLNPAQIKERMPVQSQILQYAVLEERLLIWVISRSGIQAAESKITQKNLNEKVLDYLKLISRGNEEKSGELRREASELFDILIKPVESWLDRSKQVCIVTDKALNYLPFGALISTASDSSTYLLEDYSLVMSPSASVFVFCSETAEKKKATSVERLLSVGNPRFDHAAFPALPDLPSASREAAKVSSYYNLSLPLVENDAREGQIKNEMGRSDVIHLALHSVADQRSPLRSKLVLAKEPSGPIAEEAPDGILHAYEIYNLKLPRTRLAVLSACQTGAERFYRGEGMMSIARPFMAAGVPLVVASLWPVDSDATAELMISFHKHRKKANLTTGEALRRAQVEILKGGQERFRHPYYWAAFITIGGYAQF